MNGKQAKMLRKLARTVTIGNFASRQDAIEHIVMRPVHLRNPEGILMFDKKGQPVTVQKNVVRIQMREQPGTTRETYKRFKRIYKANKKHHTERHRWAITAADA